MKLSKFIPYICICISICLFIFGCTQIAVGFDKKNEYYNSENSITSTNAYVGGDAYNYIINGTYFTGYLVLGSSSIICSTFLLTGSLLILAIYNQKSLIIDNKNQEIELPKI